MKILRPELCGNITQRQDKHKPFRGNNGTGSQERRKGWDNKSEGGGGGGMQINQSEYLANKFGAICQACNSSQEVTLH